MNLELFTKLALTDSIIPVFETFTADMISPIAAYLKIRNNSKNSFLFESVDGIGKVARYSFIGKDPVKLISNRALNLTINEEDKTYELEYNIFEYFKNEVTNFQSAKIEGLPYFTGGYVGFFGFETVGLIEEKIRFDYEDKLNIPDSIFGLYNNLIVFDHYKNQIIIISNVIFDDDKKPEDQFYNAKKNIADLRNELKQDIQFSEEFNFKDIKTNTSEEHYRASVSKALENIKEGDVFQLVLSKRSEANYSGDLFNLYRALRIINPTPYMHYIEFEEGVKIAGTSPEDLLKVRDGVATILPIAGTRKRGSNESEDRQLEEELMQDEKELAEHIMLVDLARNDLGRVCEYGSVKVIEDMHVQKYSHVMHIVSRVEGKLKNNKNCIDALVASFPAGTVSGAPKIRAIQLINNYEEYKRNIYAGAIGYIDFNGNLDLCIAIRTFFAKNDSLYWQSGAGIVADSKPELEFNECNNKTLALMKALKFAEEINESSCN